jgi:hypothetical protein
MGGACGTYGEDRAAHRVLGKNLKKTDNLEDPGVDGRILNYILQELNGGGAVSVYK